MKTLKIRGYRFKEKDVEIIGSHIKKINDKLEQQVLDMKKGKANVIEFLNNASKIQEEEINKLTAEEKEVINNYTECVQANEEDDTGKYIFFGAFATFAVIITIALNRATIPDLVVLSELGLLVALYIRNTKKVIDFIKTEKLIKMVKIYADK